MFVIRKKKNRAQFLTIDDTVASSIEIYYCAHDDDVTVEIIKLSIIC